MSGTNYMEQIARDENIKNNKSMALHYIESTPNIEFNDEKEWWNNRTETNCAWKVSIDEIKVRNYNLDFKNPNKLNSNEVLSIDDIVSYLNVSFKKSQNLISMISEELKK